MKAKELAEILLKRPEAEVMVSMPCPHTIRRDALGIQYDYRVISANPYPIFVHCMPTLDSQPVMLSLEK